MRVSDNHVCVSIEPWIDQGEVLLQLSKRDSTLTGIARLTTTLSTGAPGVLMCVHDTILCVSAKLDIYLGADFVHGAERDDANEGTHV